MDAAWAQAILSAIAIVVSGAFAVWVPYRERRINGQRENQARLAITTRRWSPVGLELEFSYLPQFTHVGISVHVEVLSPHDVELRAGKFVINPAITETGTHWRKELGGPFLDRKGTVRLTSLDDTEFLSGAIYVFPMQQPGKPIQPLTKARVRIDVVTDNQERLLSQTFGVSPIDAQS